MSAGRYQRLVMLAIGKSGLARHWPRVRLGENDFLARFGFFFSRVFGFAGGDYLRLFFLHYLCRGFRYFFGTRFDSLFGWNIQSSAGDLIRTIRTSTGQGEEKKNQCHFQFHVLFSVVWCMTMTANAIPVYRKPRR